MNFRPNWSIREVKFNPNRSIKFSQKLPQKRGKIWKFQKYYPKRVAQNEKDTQQEYIWHLYTQPEGVLEVKKGGLKGSTSLLILTGVPPTPPKCMTQY